MKKIPLTKEQTIKEIIQYAALIEKDFLEWGDINNLAIYIQWLLNNLIIKNEINIW